MIETGAAAGAGAKGLIALLIGKKAFGATALPFFIAGATGTPSPNLIRIVEALIIAGLTAGASVWATTQVLQVRMDNLEIKLSEQNTKLADLHSEIESLKSAVYVSRFDVQKMLGQKP